MDPEVIQLPPELETLSNLVEETPEKFASGSEEIRAAALSAAKFVYDLGMFPTSDSIFLCS